MFHAAALERGLIPADLPKTKNAVRDFLNSAGRKDDFTALQGYVYGTRMDLAALYPGLRDSLQSPARPGNDLFIVSHKTRHPLLGPKYDMHAAARGFLAGPCCRRRMRVPAQNIFFEQTKEEKISRAAALELRCLHRRSSGNPDDAGTSAAMPAILFDPEGSTPASNFEQCRSLG